MKFLLLYVAILLLALLSSLKKTETFTNSSRIPKIIWTYWHDKNLPEIVHLCINRWKQFNPTYEFVLLLDHNLHEYIPELELKTLSNNTVQQKADYIRAHVLKKYGGVWTDASIICNKPLDILDDLPDTIDFVGYYIEHKSIYPIIENWFFAVPHNSRFMRLWCDEFSRLNSFATPKDYVDNVKSLGVSLDDLEKYDPTYLTMHTAAQKVLQYDKYPLERIRLYDARNAPFFYLENNNWEISKAVDKLCNESIYKKDIVKLRGVERQYIIDMKTNDIQQYNNCIKKLFD